MLPPSRRSVYNKMNFSLTVEVMNSFVPSSPPSYHDEGNLVPRHRLNFKAGRSMARRSFTPEELHELRRLAAQRGKIVARRAFGDHGPGRDVDFATMEQIARAAAAGLTEGTLQTLLQQQADALGEQQPCPDCGRPCPLRRQERPLQVEGGQLQQSEPLGHCPDCRRDFFPPAAPAAP
jgi:hypothetical protein